MSKIYVPPDYAHLFPSMGADVWAWREELTPALIERDGRCWVTGCAGHTFSSIHEYIRRSRVQGWPKKLRVLIHCLFGCVVLCDLHHETYREPAPEEIADWMHDEYGEDYVLWLRSLPFVKVRHPLEHWLYNIENPS